MDGFKFLTHTLFVPLGKRAICGDPRGPFLNDSGVENSESTTRICMIRKTF